MQEMLDDLKETRELCYKAGLKESVSTLDDIIERTIIRLYNEKLMIYNTYEDCKENVLKMIMEKKKMSSMIDYYKETFNQNEI